MRKRAPAKTVSSGGSPFSEIPGGRGSIVPELGWRAILVSVLVVVALVIYWPALHGNWLWDDDLMITSNALVLSAGGLWETWLEPWRMLDFQPITATVCWLGWHLWGSNTVGFHVLSLSLHLAGAMLFWRVLSRLGLQWGWLGALLFVVHPVMVESVAWIAELKNTLSLPPFLLAVLYWFDYEKRRAQRDYLLSLGLFMVAMLCKPSMVMFPLVILLYAWYRRGRVGREDLRASAPFLAVSLAVGIATMVFLRLPAGANHIVGMGGAGSRLGQAGLSLAFYFSKAVLPVGLITIYPKWKLVPPSAVEFLPWLVLAVLLGFLWHRRAGWGRPVLLGLGFFIVMLLPFLGFVIGSYMKFCWAMDHIVYLPILGLVGLAVAALENIDNQWPGFMRPFGVILLASAIFWLAEQSRFYTRFYHDQASLWGRVVQLNPAAWIAYGNLGHALMEQGRISAAEALYQQDLYLEPDDVPTLDNYGTLLLRQNHPQESIPYYQLALKYQPKSYLTLYDLGVAYQALNQDRQAIDQYQQVVRLDPDFTQAWENLGQLLWLAGRSEDALQALQKAANVDPEDWRAYGERGLIYMKEGKRTEAIREFNASLRINPNDNTARMNLVRLNAPYTPGL